jgi:HlyD family secretion protein
VWLKAYIGETNLGKVNLGQQVEVVTDTYPDKKYTGKIYYISSEAEFTPKNLQTKEDRVKLVYRIKIALDNPNQELKPGMIADGKIETDENAKVKMQNAK